jgi:hypothetical protein
LKVLWGSDGWELMVDYTGGKDFQSEGTHPRDPVPSTQYLGIYCKYTTSNSKKFYFDDFYAGPPLFDIFSDSHRYDIVINEIMADPSPPSGLPEHEYLELYNTTSHSIDLYDWKLMIGNSEKSLTGAKIGPYGYLIIAKEDALDELSSFGNFWGQESFSLSNAGQEVILLNHRNELIDHVYYRDHWYSDPDKQDGGFSLEMINPFNPCTGQENWGASEYFKGGTPGDTNSIFNQNDILPAISRVCVPDANRIELIFNQSMHPDLIGQTDVFSINNGIGNINVMLPADPWFTSFTLYPEKQLFPGLIYEISCNSFIHNCSGDSVFLTERFFAGLPGQAEWNDIIINEVLFDPFSGGCDFVELYNRSDRVISLAGMRLGVVKYSPPEPPDTSFLTLREDCIDILPGDFMVLCKNTEGIERFYYCTDSRKLFSALDFPSLSKKGGHIIIMSKEGKLLDAFSYHENMHYPLLNNTGGVSLERIHYDGLSQDANNWHSASFHSGFATPGYRNSQYSDGSTIDDHIHVSPRVFSPGYDGINDHISIRYSFTDPGMLANITVMNASGCPVRQLVNNELLGTSGSIVWNGLNDHNIKAAAGIYIILVELTDIKGRVARYKNTVVIAP